MPTVEPDPTRAPAEAGGLRSRRARVAVGVAGLAVVLGGGAYLIAAQNDGAHDTAGPAAPTPAVETGVASADAVEPSATMSASAPSASVSPSATVALAKSEAERIAEIKKFAEAHGAKGFKPALPRTTAQAVAAADAKVTNTGSPKTGTMRVITAHGDLTGQRELGWVAGGISRFADVECSQTFQWESDGQPAKQKNMVVCWRTSAQKSVVTVVVDPHGHPSRQKSADTINREWSKLG